MKNLKQSIYDKFGNYNFLGALTNSDFNLGWGIEAGCHNGSDTKNFLQYENIKKIYAFEPDPVAREAAKTTLNQFLSSRVEISEFALMDQDSEVSLVPHEGKKGTGNSQISKQDNSEENKLIARSLDSYFSNVELLDFGFLWLDVEGQALNVLKGGKQTFKHIALAKIEVEMYEMGEIRKANALKVLDVMKSYGFSAQALPIYPGNFGDIIFVRKSLIGRRLIIQGYLREWTFVLLHAFLYPRIGKPTRPKS